MKKNDKNNLEYINQAIGDTRYILDDFKPCKGIKKVLIIWLSLFIVYNALLYCYSTLLINTSFYASDLYYRVIRISDLLWNTINFIVYLVDTLKLNMTIKERDFLKAFMIYPLFISILKSLETISSYINIEFMLSLYQTVPFDLIITLLAIIQLYRYFNDKKFVYISIFVFAFIIIIGLFRIYAFNTDGKEVTAMISTLTMIYHYFDTIAYYSIVPIISFGLSILFMRDKNGRKYS